MVVTNHAVKQFKRRVNDAPDSNVKRILLDIVRECMYVSDDSRGVLLRHNGLSLEVIVKHRKVITVYPIVKR